MLNYQRVLEEFDSQISFFRLFSTSEDLSEQPGFPAGLKTSFWHATSTQILQSSWTLQSISKCSVGLAEHPNHGYCVWLLRSLDHCIHEKLCAAATWCDNLTRSDFTITAWSFPEMGGTPKSSISVGFSIINLPSWDTPILGNLHIYIIIYIFITRISPVDECSLIGSDLTICIS